MAKNIPKRYYFMIIGLAMTIGVSALAQNKIYVGLTGTDTNGYGSFNQPYKTIEYAAEQAQPGDSVLVFAGTYRNASFGDDDIWNGDNLAKITANGTADKFITLSPYLNDRVILEFDDTYGVLIYNSSYLRIVGFEIKGIADQISYDEAIAAWGLYKDAAGEVHDLAIEMGVDPSDPEILGRVIDKPAKPDIKKPAYYNGRGLVANNSHHIEFINNKVHDCPSSAIRAQQSDFIVIQGNEVYHNTYWTSQGVGAITVAEASNITSDQSDDIKIRLIQNKVYENENRLISWNPGKTFVNFVIDEGTGLFLTRNKDTYTHGKILIANNLSYRNGASGIVCHVTDRAIIEHNTVVNNGTTNTGDAGGIGVNNADDVLIQNNISYSRTNKWALGILANPVTNLVVKKNIIYNQMGEEPVSRNIDEGWQEADPKVMDLSSDFRLINSSPCIDNGMPEINMLEDYTGYVRVDGNPDIGAIEYNSVTSIGLDEKKINEIDVYPNPGDGQFTIFGINNSADINCWNYLGREVAVDITAKLDHRVTIQLKQAGNGVYLLVVDNQTFKLIVDNNY